MNFNEMLDVLIYAIKHYRDDEMKNRFTMYEYYSLTDISPKELASIVHKQKKISLAICLREYGNNSFWQQQEVKMYEELTYLHSINGKELTPLDKLTIADSLIKEGYPLISGTYNMAARYYERYGAEGISKEETRNKIIKFYCDAKGIKYDQEIVTKKDSKILIK